MVQMHGDSRSFSVQHGARVASLTLSARPLAILLCGCAPTRGFKQEGPASDTRLLGLATGRSVKTQQSLNVSASPSLFTSFQMAKRKKESEFSFGYEHGTGHCLWPTPACADQNHSEPW